jgi:hypothetical protein
LGDSAAFARWMEDQLTEAVKPHRPLDTTAPGEHDGVFFAGTWHSMAEIVIAVAGLLEAGRHVELRALLENFSAKWSKHWMVPFVLAEIEHRKGQHETAVEYLMESIGLRTYHLPLYRLLSARLNEYQYDKTMLGEFLQQQFGITLAYLEQQGAPTVLEVLGIEVEQEVEATPALA